MNKLIIVLEDGLVSKVMSNKQMEVIVYDRDGEQDIIQRHKAQVGLVDLEGHVQNCATARFWWEILGDIPVDSEECIEEDVTLMDRDFDKGTEITEIWHWFEDTFDISVAEDLMYLNPNK